MSEQANLTLNKPEEYGATRKWPFHISCGGAVYRQDEGRREYALLCRLPRHDEQNETWHLPKGTLHHDETLEQCARREIGEESGRNVSIGAYLGSLHGRWTMPSGKRMDKATHFFLCRDVDATPEGMDAEHDRLEWFPPDVALEKLETEPKGEGEIIRRAEQWLMQFVPTIAPNAATDV